MRKILLILSLFCFALYGQDGATTYNNGAITINNGLLTIDSTALDSIEPLLYNGIPVISNGLLVYKKITGVNVAVPNSGYSTTTDWINPTNGLAQLWTDIDTTSGMSYEIITGSGFTGNAQKLSITPNDAGGAIVSNTFNIVVGKTYKIRLKYTGINSFSILEVKRNSDEASIVTMSNFSNPATATEIESAQFISDESFIYILIAFTRVGVSAADFTIDELVLIEIL